MNNTNIYKLKCNNNHEIELDLTDLQETLKEYYSCEKCNEDFISMEPHEVIIECPVCAWNDHSDLSNAIAWLDQECPNCSKNLLGTQSLYIYGSFQYECENYYEHCKRNTSKKVKRIDRPDYWEAVIHFTNQNKLITILKENTINAYPTGLLKGEAVCLTEVPMEFTSEIRKKFGDYGIVFKKSDILRFGGGPAVYLTDEVIDGQKQNGFCNEIIPFLNVVRIPSTAPINNPSKRVDYLHEREWRVPKNIDLSILKPLGLLFPEGTPAQKFSYKEWKVLIDYAFKFGEFIK